MMEYRRYESTPHTLSLPNHSQEDGKHPIITRQDILGRDGSAYILRGVLTPAECKEYINHAESLGFNSCGYVRSIRQTDRVAARSEPVAKFLFDRIKPYLDTSVDLSSATEDTWPTGIPKRLRRWQWFPIGLNETFRICRYEKGGFFRPHHDGGFVRSEFERSIKTFMIYLNDEFVGGETNFYDETQRRYQRGIPEKIIYSFKPQAGDALVFNSDITHDGAGVRSGHKYIMRSEIMYSPCNEEEEQKQNASGFAPDHEDIDDFRPD